MRYLIVVMGVLAAFPSVAAPPETTPSPPPAKEPAAKDPAAAAIAGTWRYAKDPTGAVATDPIYEGSTITFAPDGRYTFRLAQFPRPLEGTWELRGAEADTVRVHTEYGQGRRNHLTLTLRRDAGGAVTGMVVREGDGSTGARLYVRESG
ncbi:MAG: hypothetical protein ACK4YP_17340 [Myxococcota bacterium]